MTLQFVKSAEIKEDERREREKERRGQVAEKTGERGSARERVCEGQNTRKECKTKAENSKDARGLRKLQNNEMEG